MPPEMFVVDTDNGTESFKCCLNEFWVDLDIQDHVQIKCLQQGFFALNEMYLKYWVAFHTAD